jgi:Na+/H+ antiporter NhaD/arsenite permease-like protein
MEGGPSAPDPPGVILSTAVFVLALGLIASERVDRTKVALLGGGAVVVLGLIDQEHAIEAVEWEALGVLVGMMVAVRLLETTGVFAYAAIRAAQLSRGRPFVLLLTIAAVTAVLSAFLDNLTTVLLVVPVTFVIADLFDIDVVPLVIVEVLASNIGGTATLIGDPPNIMIAGFTGLSFDAFIANLAPVVVVTFAVVLPLCYLVFRRRLQIAPERRDRALDLDAPKAIEDRDELRRVGPVLVLIVLAFFVHKPLGLEPATVALAGASVMLAVTNQRIEEALGGIDWPTIFFFLGLFVMVGALEHSGAVEELAEGIVSATAGDRTAELLAISWLAAIVGGIIDNIPLTATMIPVVDTIAGENGDDAYWWALALGACFGGNLTIVSAAANVAAAGLAARAGKPIGFVAFLRVGVPVTFLSMGIVTVYILLRYA